MVGRNHDDAAKGVCIPLNFSPTMQEIQTVAKTEIAKVEAQVGIQAAETEAPAAPVTDSDNYPAPIAETEEKKEFFSLFRSKKPKAVKPQDEKPSKSFAEKSKSVFSGIFSKADLKQEIETEVVATDEVPEEPAEETRIVPSAPAPVEERVTPTEDVVDAVTEAVPVVVPVPEKPTKSQFSIGTFFYKKTSPEAAKDQDQDQDETKKDAVQVIEEKTSKRRSILPWKKRNEKSVAETAETEETTATKATLTESETKVESEHVSIGQRLVKMLFHAPSDKIEKSSETAPEPVAAN